MDPSFDFSASKFTSNFLTNFCEFPTEFLTMKNPSLLRKPLAFSRSSSPILKLYVSSKQLRWSFKKINDRGTTKYFNQWQWKCARMFLTRAGSETDFMGCSEQQISLPFTFTNILLLVLFLFYLLKTTNLHQKDCKTRKFYNFPISQISSAALSLARFLLLN